MIYKETNKVRPILDKKQQAYITLRDRIFSGYYYPRQRLIETSLSKELAVNRSVLREILKRLTTESLVVSERYKGSFVADISIDDVHEFYQIEALLEGGAAFLSTSHLKEEEIRRLEKLIDESKRLTSDNAERWGYYNRQIHKLINTACGNSKLIKAIRVNVKFIKYWFIALSTPPEIHKRNEDHELILETIKKRNPDKVRQLMEKHILDEAENMLERLKNKFPPFSGNK